MIESRRLVKKLNKFHTSIFSSLHALSESEKAFFPASVCVGRSDQATGKLGMQAGLIWWITRAQGRAAEITPATYLEVAPESQ